MLLIPYRQKSQTEKFKIAKIQLSFSYKHLRSGTLPKWNKSLSSDNFSNIIDMRFKNMFIVDGKK